MPHDDPLRDVEDKKGQEDMGVMAARTFTGALAESGSIQTAFWSTSAFFCGMFKSGKEDDPEDA